MSAASEARESAIEAAALAVRRGALVVIPTDTVYGVAADAFDADAVQLLLDAKGRGRDMPPPVLVSAPGTIDALAIDVPGWARALLDAFWPGGLTLICRQQPSLQWDIGETRGTVAVRMPDHAVTLEILERTGPLAVSSANVTGEPAATTADDADDMLGDAISVLLDDGPSPGGVASTIVDATTPEGRVLREGALSTAELNAVIEPLGAVLTGPDAAGDPDDADDDTDGDTDDTDDPGVDLKKPRDEGE
nr:L-threonylcarbamoyladenylate synthase [uncultured Nocardioides sp.]